MTFLVALIISVIGVLPIFISRKMIAGAVTLIISTLLSWWIIWGLLPSMVWPLFGFYGAWVVALWIVSTIISGIDTGRYNTEWKPNWSLALPIIGVVAFILVEMGGCGALRSGDYAKLIGHVEERVWTQDVQPKDPKHIRMVTKELASWLADKQIGNAPGAIGSQFHVSKKHMTLQMVDNQLWYIAPLEFNGFTEWTNADVSPGFVMIDAEDPYFPVQVKLEHEFKYMTEACFGNNLERYLWNNGYMWKGLTDYSFEIDDSLNPYWIITVFEPTITFFGSVVKGVVTVNPTTGEIKEYSLGDIPHWIDRVIPKSFIADYIDYMGAYANGWRNSVWGKKDLIEGEEPTINYGSDGEPYWVTTLTSTAVHDESMVGLIYTDSRTGKSVRYKAKGGTEAGVLQAVNNAIVYKHFHGSGPVLYNIYGTMASIVPLLGENHTFQGVAIVEVDKMIVAIGEDQYEALLNYQNLLAKSGHQIAPEFAHANSKITGVVERFSTDVKGGETHYYVFLKDGKMFFTAESQLSPKLPLTVVGDSVLIEYIDSKETTVPMIAFENKALPVMVSKSQQAVNEANQERREHIDQTSIKETVRGTVDNMSDEELMELLNSKADSSK